MQPTTRRRTLIAALGAAIPATSSPATPASAPQDLAKEKKELLRRANEQWQAEYQKQVAATKAAERRGEFSSLAPPKALIPFKDWDYYYTQGISLWKPNAGQTFKPVAVPDRFVTDLTSIPQAVWSFGIRPEGAYAYAAVVHDYLYWMQDRTREESDEIFLTAMVDSKVEESLRNRIYNAVRVGGNAAWKKNAELKKRGEKRVLRHVPKDFTIAWNDWKSRPGVFKD
ncbi:DUF1353 domain-containing protein [Aquincola sp. S2]|uniref:DUF1353 domain-containing protein n=1 Tax=Pseudaquabacterium terrae TaxID=2732868 RepID=A0ABX2ERM5_9BURK|nr:DUF1353 domain-containing protein [Aquabacterium terrae]NRF71330.1 DUF1353 domain-containing protein [Aquabacterium terrae]